MQAKIAWQLLVLLTACLGIATVSAEEIAADKLPKAIVDRIHTRFPHMEIDGGDLQRAKGRDKYIVEIKGPDGPFHVAMSAAGAISSVAYEGKYVPGYLVAPIEHRYPGAEILYATEADDASLQSEASVYLRHQKHNIIAHLSFGGGKGGWLIFNEYQQVAETDLPEKVLAAAHAKYPKASVSWAESLSTTRGVINSYDVWLTAASKKTISMSIAPDGEILSHGESEPPPQEKIFARQDSKNNKAK